MALVWILKDSSSLIQFTIVEAAKHDEKKVAGLSNPCVKIAPSWEKNSSNLFLKNKKMIRTEYKNAQRPGYLIPVWRFLPAREKLFKTYKKLKSLKNFKEN